MRELLLGLTQRGTWKQSKHDQRLFAQTQRRPEVKSALSTMGQLGAGVTAMKRDCVRPSAWGAASKGFFCATVFGLSMQIGPVLAQSGQSLPPVTVDAPKPQAARPTQPSRRAARSQSATAGRRARAAAERGARRSRRGWRTRQRTGGRLSRQSKRDRHQDGHADFHHTAVDLGRDQGSDRRPGRAEPRRGVALHTRRHARHLWRYHHLRRHQASRLRRAALSRWPSAAVRSRNAIRRSEDRNLRS